MYETAVDGMNTYVDIFKKICYNHHGQKILFNLPERTGGMTETELFSVAGNIKKYILSDRNIDFDCHSGRMQVELLIKVLYYYDIVFFLFRI